MDANRKTLRAASVVRGTLEQLRRQAGLPRHPSSGNRPGFRGLRARFWALIPQLAAVIALSLPSGSGVPALWADDVIEPFESAQVSWKLVEEDCSPRVFSHQRTTQQRHDGDFSELIQFQAGVGTKAYWLHHIPAARVLPEFSPSVWVRSNRTGIRLYALVVFPHEPSATGEGAVQRLIPGPTYEDRGDWEKLEFASLPQDFEALYHRAVQAARLASSDGKFDDRDAYISAVILNTYGGQGSTAVWIDDLGLSGFVPADRSESPNNNLVQPAAWQSPDEWASSGRTTVPYRSDSIVMADDRPFMLKIADHHGEPFEYLQGLGFNTLRLSEAPTLAVNQEAARLNLWLIAPPPRGFRAMADDRAYTRVLAWNLGSQLDLRSQDRVEETVRSLRSSPATAGRLLHAETRWSGWGLSRSADLVELQVTSELGSTTGRQPYDTVTHAAAIAPSGTPLIATLPLEASPELVRQVAAMAGQVPDLEAPPEACKNAMFQAAAAGVRGVALRTYTRLDGTDPAAQRRANLAAWLNQWLDQMEPWIAGGSPAGSLKTTRPEWVAAARSTERSRMILLFERPGVAGPPTHRELSIVDTQASSSSPVYRVTPSGPAPVVLNRSPGSVNMIVPQRGTSEMLVSTQDPMILRHLSAAVQDENLGQRRLELHHDLLMYWISKQSQVHGELDVYQAGSAESLALYRQALQTLRISEQQLLSRNYASVHQTLLNGSKELAQSRQILLSNATGQFPQANTSPLCLDISSLPGHWDLALRLGQVTWQGSVLAGGDFENLDHLIRSGWTHERWGFDEDRVEVNLTNTDVRSGSRALQIDLSRQNHRAAASHLPPQVRVSSGPIQLLPNQIARFHGWLKIDPLPGEQPPLVWIEDSLGGPGLGRWIRPTVGVWQEFTFYRGAFSEEADQIVFEIQGYGTVKIDQVTVHVAQPVGRTVGNQPAPEIRETLERSTPLR
jgi:hypothetical protein